jgi:hypothetical protein
MSRIPGWRGGGECRNGREPSEARKGQRPAPHEQREAGRLA